MHDRVWLPICIASAAVMALALSFFFGLYGKPEHSEWHVEGSMTQGQSGQFVAGLILGTGLGWGLGSVVAEFLIAPAWWWLFYASKKKTQGIGN